MNGRFQGKVVLVTGGSSGIGRATALAFAREGAKVVITARRSKESDDTVRMIREAGGEGFYIRADVSQRGEVEELILKTVERYGRLDCACNNAFIPGDRAPTADCTEENWDKVIDINLKGVWLCMKYEIAQMLKQGGGAIVNISSAQAFVALPNKVAYVGSKHGILGITKSAALEYITAGIRVNAVCPGITLTEPLEKVLVENPGIEAQFIERIPIRRFAKAEEIAETVLWLCSDASSYVVGHALVVDGGVLVGM
jgi:NAD(P)-dependent dehydrogenase (short-subunit alcohol dehydrogenase family)